MPSQGKFEGFDSCDWPRNLTKIGLKSSINQLVWPWNLMNDLEKQEGTSSILHQTLCIISNPFVNSNWSYSPEMLNSGKNWRFFLSRLILKFDGWSWKIIGHLFYTTLSFVRHFQAIGIFKLELQSVKCSIRVKIGDLFVPGDFENWCMTLKNNRAPLLYYIKLCAWLQIHWWSQAWVTAWKRSSRVKIGHFFIPRDLENWRITLKNNRVPLLCCFNLCASFHNQWWVQTGATVWKHPIWVKIDDF